MRILLVEDDPILALIAASALEDEGHQIVGPAYDDEQALALAETQSADIALVDINLAGHDEGISLARSLLEAARYRLGVRQWAARGGAQ